MTSEREFRLRLWAAMVLMVAALAVPLPLLAQDDRVESISAAAVELSRLERDGDMLTLHDRLHPDVRLVVSRAALGAWYQVPGAVIPTADPEILSVTFGSWMWPVTGRVYADVATVVLRQPGAVGQMEIRHAQFDGAHWRWFFGSDRATIEALAARVPADAAPGVFGDVEYARVDLVWSGIYAQAGIEYRSPAAVNMVSLDQFPIQTGCGSWTEDVFPEGFYCELDREIYLEAGFRDVLRLQAGNHAWPLIIAHEWGHQIQLLEGIDSSPNPELDGGLYVIEKELQADCLAGVYAQESVARGWLDVAELDNLYQIAILGADEPDTPFDDSFAHGSADQRYEAFMTGFEDGLSGCNLDLTPDA